MMKKVVISLAALLLTSTCSLAQSSTPLKGDLNGDGRVDVADVTALVNIILTSGNGNINVPDTPDEGRWSKQVQTAFLDATARELIAMAPATDFLNVKDLPKELYRTNAYNIEDWAKNIYNKTIETLGTSSSTETYNYGSVSIVDYITTEYRSAYDISQFKGTFELRNGVWVCTNTDTDDLTFSYKDSSGNVWILKATTSGQVKRIYAKDTESYRWIITNIEYNGSGYVYYYKDYTDVEHHIIGIPENVMVTLTKNGSQVMKTTIRTDLTNITDMDFNLAESNLSVVATTEVNEYKVEVSQLVYQANRKASVGVKVSKAGKALLTMAVAGDVMDIPSVNVSALDKHFKIEEGNARNVFVKLDVLGKVQVQGTVSDVKAMVEKYEAAQKNRSDETVFKANIAQMNTYFNLGLFYNNENTMQAGVYLEPFAKRTWYGYSNWEADMVISFDDMSTYSTCMSFFSESNFQGVMDSWAALCKNYERLFTK